MAKSIVIEIKNLHKTFEAGNQKIEVLRGINCQIHSGEYVIFFGPSGCGKSTLLNVISGLEPPTEGEILVRGKSLYKEPQKEITEYRRSKIGIVFQQFNLLKSLTVQENVALPLMAGRESYQARMHRASTLLDLVGLGKFLDRKPVELSGGQQQRVAVARALAVNPWIVICDEPTGNLDSKSADEIMEIIAHLNSKSKRTVILVTHNPEYLKYPHRVIFFKDGQIVQEQVNREVDSPENEEHADVDFKDSNSSSNNPIENQFPPQQNSEMQSIDQNTNQVPTPEVILAPEANEQIGQTDAQPQPSDLSHEEPVSSDDHTFSYDQTQQNSGQPGNSEPNDDHEQNNEATPEENNNENY